MQRDLILLQLSEDNVMSSVGGFGKSPPPRAQSPSLQRYRAVVHGTCGLTWLRQALVSEGLPHTGLTSSGMGSLPSSSLYSHCPRLINKALRDQVQRKDQHRL